MNLKRFPRSRLPLRTNRSRSKELKESITMPDSVTGDPSISTWTLHRVLFRFLSRIEYSDPNGRYTTSSNSRSTLPLTRMAAAKLLEYIIFQSKNTQTKCPFCELKSVRPMATTIIAYSHVNVNVRRGLQFFRSALPRTYSLPFSQNHTPHKPPLYLYLPHLGHTPIPLNTRHHPYA